MKRPQKDLAFWLVGYKKTSTRGSNFRRLWSRVAIYLSLILGIAAFVNTLNQSEPPKGILPILPLIFYFLFGFGYFYDVVLRTPFRSSNDFTINPRRLLLDTLVSSMLFISIFATLYWYSGFGKNGLYMNETPLDAFYFSTVTFSTLGYGDLSPSNSSKFFAALQAVIGNIHLGFVVGSAFAAIQNQVASADKNEPDDDVTKEGDVKVEPAEVVLSEEEKAGNSQSDGTDGNKN